MNSKRVTYFIIILLVITILGCTNKKIRENETIAKSFAEAWSTHDIDKLTSLFTEDCLYEEVATGKKYVNKKAIAEYANYTISGIPDTKFEIVSIITSDNMATIEWIWKATNTVGWPGAPPTKKYFEIRGVSVMVIEDNLIKRNSDYWDLNTFLKGMGVPPSDVP